MGDSRGARLRRRGGLTGLVTGLLAAAVVASGCSVIPSGTGPQPASAPPPPAGAGPCCGLLVRPPQAGWGPTEVVRNFLLASAIGANDYAVARQYLTKKASDAWRPGTAVTILTKEPTVSEPPGRVSGPAGPGTQNIVAVSGQEQARLSSTGQYKAASGGVTAHALEFGLAYTKGLWKISQLFPTAPGKVSNGLLLTSDLFHLEYTPRNLYYYGRRNAKLLPYPVFVPIQGTNPAGTLINDLIHGPSGWLAGAVSTAFPAGAHLVPPIQVFPGPSGGRTAVVNIAVPPHSPGLNVQAMAAQLVTTLTSPVYSAPLFRAVKLKINGHPWSPGRHAADTLSLSTYQRDIPQSAGRENAYYLSPGGGLHSLTAQSDRGSAVLRAAGTTPVTLSQIAVSPGGGHLAGLAGPANTVYTGNLVTVSGRQSVRQLHAQFTGIKFTSLSWDRLGDLWVTGTTKSGPGVWVLISGLGHAAVPLNVPSDLGRITALRVAPDGNRVAMIVGTGAKARLVLAAIMHDQAGFLLTATDPLGPSLPPLSGLTWFDEDHLLVVTGSGEDSQLWEVPVDGDNPKPLIKQAGILTVTAAGPGNPLYLSLAGGKKEKAVGPNQPLGDITAGQAVIYPG
jgi:Lipoprotein LpqB beta-propeller domain